MIFNVHGWFSVASSPYYLSMGKRVVRSHRPHEEIEKKKKKKLSSTSSSPVGFHMPCWRWLGIVAFFFIAEGKIKSRGRGSPTPRLFILLWYFRWHIWKLQNIYIYFFTIIYDTWYIRAVLAMVMGERRPTSAAYPWVGSVDLQNGMSTARKKCCRQNQSTDVFCMQK